MASATYGEHPTWTPARPRYRPARVVLSWLVSALALLIASYLVPHVTVHGLGGAIVASALLITMGYGAWTLRVCRSEKRVGLSSEGRL